MIHAYEHPLIAVLMNPVHAMFDPATMRLFVAEGEIVAREGQLKCGVHALKVVEEIPVPTLTNKQRVKFVILCAKMVCKDFGGLGGEYSWNIWADIWERIKTETAVEAEWAVRVAEMSRGDVGSELDLIQIVERFNFSGTASDIARRVAIKANLPQLLHAANAVEWDDYHNRAVG